MKISQQKFALALLFCLIFGFRGNSRNR